MGFFPTTAVIAIHFQFSSFWHLSIFIWLCFVGARLSRTGAYLWQLSQSILDWRMLLRGIQNTPRSSLTQTSWHHCWKALLICLVVSIGRKGDMVLNGKGVRMKAAPFLLIINEIHCVTQLRCREFQDVQKCRYCTIPPSEPHTAALASKSFDTTQNLLLEEVLSRQLNLRNLLATLFQLIWEAGCCHLGTYVWFQSDLEKNPPPSLPLESRAEALRGKTLGYLASTCWWFIVLLLVVDVTVICTSRLCSRCPIFQHILTNQSLTSATIITLT